MWYIPPSDSCFEGLTMTKVRFWRRCALALWVAAIACFGVGWFADKPTVGAATPALVVCYIVAAARSRTLARECASHELAANPAHQHGRG